MRDRKNSAISPSFVKLLGALTGTHARRLKAAALPRPVATGDAEIPLDFRQSDMIGPAIGADRDVVAAT
jgi:hypothetical protein